MADHRKGAAVISWRTALFAFLLSCLLWLLVNLGRTYSTFIRLPVSYSGIPEDVQFNEDPPASIDVFSEASGITVLLNKFGLRRDSIHINVAACLKKGYFVWTDQDKEINSNFTSGITGLYIRPDTIYFNYQKKSSKRVPVVSRVDVQLEPTFRLIRPVKITPDSITVIGGKEILQDISEWNTVVYSTPVIAAPTTFDVDLEQPSNVEIAPSKVTVSVDPAEFTEDYRTVKIKVINVPDKKQLKLTQTEVKVKYLVTMDKFDKIKVADFGIEIDFKKIKSGSKHVVPDLVRKPQGIEVVAIEPSKISYVIVTKK